MPNPHTPQATLAALCIFNGLRLSPLFGSPIPGLCLAGPKVAPRFDQCRNYLSRFFNADSTADDYAPLEVFSNGTVAAAQWIRGAVGIMQYALYSEFGIDVPDATDIDPAAWFDDLDRLAYAFHEAEDSVPSEAVERLLEAWQEPDIIPKHEDSRQSFLSAYYGQARDLQTTGAFLTTVPAITRARHTGRTATQKS